MNGDVDIRPLLNKFLLISLSLHLAILAVTAYCPDRCSCMHGQLICGGAVRRGPPVEEITRIPDRLDDIDAPVQIGNFSRNFITQIGKASFVGLEEARILDLSHNFIATIADGAFEMGSPNIELKILYLAYNQLHELRPGMFQGLNNLWQLFAGHNHFKVIENDALSNMPELHLISLRNSLWNWDYSTRPFEPLTKLRMVYFAQTDYSGCECALLDFMDDLILSRITILDETEARKFCSRDVVSCGTRSPMTTIDYAAAGIMPPKELVPPVSDEGVITFDGESHSLLSPEGRNLLKLYDIAIRRMIAQIQIRSLRAKYEHRFRLEMRRVIQKYFYGNEAPALVAEEADQNTSTQKMEQMAEARGQLQPTAPRTIHPGNDSSTTPPSSAKQVNPYKHLNALLAKGFAKYKHKHRRPVTTEAPEAPVIEMAPTGYLDIGIVLAIVLISITVSFFATSIVIALSMGWSPWEKKKDLLKEDEEEEGDPGCFGRITRKLAVRKNYLRGRGRTSPAKGQPFSTYHETAKDSIEGEKLLQNLGSGPLPEDAIEALTREQRRRTLGGASQASSEFTAFDSDSDSDQEIFAHDKYDFGT